MSNADIIDWNDAGDNIPTVEYTRERITQDRGPTIRFYGRLLAETTYEAGERDRFQFTIEIWETRGGALVGVSRKVPLSWEGEEDCDAVVAEPAILDAGLHDETALVMMRADDTQRMRLAIMDLFRWHERARSLVRKKLKWKLTKDVA